MPPSTPPRTKRFKTRSRKLAQSNRRRIRKPSARRGSRSPEPMRAITAVPGDRGERCRADRPRPASVRADHCCAPKGNGVFASVGSSDPAGSYTFEMTDGKVTRMIVKRFTAEMNFFRSELKPAPKVAAATKKPPTGASSPPRELARLPWPRLHRPRRRPASSHLVERQRGDECPLEDADPGARPLVPGRSGATVSSSRRRSAAIPIRRSRRAITATWLPSMI